MKRKQTIAIVSTSALAAGMAKGAVLYSGLVNYQFPCNTNSTTVPYDSQGFSVDGSGIFDFYVGFDGYTNPNVQKPFIQGYPPAEGLGTPYSTVLARYNATYATWGLPVTKFGTNIDANFLAPNLGVNQYGQPLASYFDQDGNGKQTGDWLTNLKTEGYVGMELWDGGGNTNFAWVRIIVDETVAPAVLTVVDYAYETTAFVGIPAGSTNDSGVPIIYASPSSQTAPAFSSIQLSVSALGNSPLAYQWQAGAVGSQVYTNLTDGGVVLGSQTPTLTNASVSVSADYVAVVTNSLGKATSSPATITVVYAPVVTPAPQTLFAGLTANFRINIGAGSPAFRWRCAGTNLSNGGRFSGVNTNHLAIQNLQTSDSGNYDVVVTSGSLVVTSSVSALTVLPYFSQGKFDQAVVAAGPVAYYRLNETGNPAAGNLVAYDNVSALNGVYGIDVTNGFSGVAGPQPANGFPGFAANNNAALITYDNTNSWITLAPWNLDTNSATIVAWINPANAENYRAGVVTTLNPDGSLSGINYNYTTNEYAPPGTIDIGYRWHDDGNGELWDTGIATPSNQWSMVAMALAPTNSSFYLFNTSGVQAANTFTNLFFPTGFTNLVVPFSNPEYIGTDPEDSSGARNFTGAIGPVAVFEGMMSSNQLQTLYNAAVGILPPVTLQLGKSGANLQLSWTLGQLLQATNVTGPWTTNSLATSPYTVTPTGTMFYRVRLH